jgi:hypothetical protein
VRYKYEDEAQKAVDRLDGWCLPNPHTNFEISIIDAVLGLGFMVYFSWLLFREVGRREGDDGAVRQVRPKR